MRKPPVRLPIVSTRILGAAAVAGIAAGTIEIIPAIFIQKYVRGIGPTHMFQGIVSGAIGDAAYAQGISAAVLGFEIHLAIAIVAAFLFIVAAMRFDMLSRHAIPSGMLFGVCAYAFMRYVVEPLSAIGFVPPTTWNMMGVSLIVHSCCFGLPISLISRKAIKRSL